MSKRFYTCVTKRGKYIFHRYIENGVPYDECVEFYPFELFTETAKESEYKSIDGKNLKRHQFDNMSQAYKFLEQQHDINNVYGNTDFGTQFIAKEYPYDVYEDKGVKIIYFDIEVEHGTGIPKYFYNHQVKIKKGNDEKIIKLEEIKNYNGYLIFDVEQKKYVEYNESCYAPLSLGFPEPSLANYEILSVSIAEPDTNTLYIIGNRPYNGEKEIDGYKVKYYYCENEKTLLRQFISVWRKISAHIVSGWNTVGFDLPYCINRITNVLGEGYSNMLSPFYGKTKNVITKKMGDAVLVYNILGIVSYDYLDLYKKFGKKVESYRLDFVAELELGVKKVDYDEYGGNLMKLWEYDYDKFIRYNARDTTLLPKLNAKLQMISLAMSIGYITKSDLKDSLGTVKIWDNLVYGMLSAENIQIHNKEKSETKDEKYLGAFVKPPILGRHDWIITHDLTSLYPMIIMGFNMSPDTLYHRPINKNGITEQTKILIENATVINDIIENESHSSNSSFKIEQSVTEVLDEKLLKKANKKELERLIDEIFEMVGDDNSHDYIHGHKNLLKLIEAFVDGEIDTDFAKALNTTVAGNGAMFTKNKIGIFPKAMRYLYQKRKTLKDQMKDLKKVVENEKRLRQQEKQS